MEEFRERETSNGNHFVIVEGIHEKHIPCQTNISNII